MQIEEPTPVNEMILLKNNRRKPLSLLSNLYRIDDTSVNYKKAKTSLL